MRILYIFPHPDDETFGPAPVIAQQRRRGHEVHLLTLTKGGATKQRLKYNYTIEKMGNVRAKEMNDVKKVLDLTSMTILDLPDSGLKDMDPREIETVIKESIEKIKPEIVVTYAVHGISGFHDHIVCHAVVKRVYCELKENGADYLKRLALYTVTSEQAETPGIMFKLNSSKPEEISCLVPLSPEDIEVFEKALDCYVTYKEVIEGSGVKRIISKHVAFELFQEKFNPPLTDLTEKLD